MGTTDATKDQGRRLEKKSPKAVSYDDYLEASKVVLSNDESGNDNDHHESPKHRNSDTMNNAHATEFADQLWRDLATMGEMPEYEALLGKPTIRERLVALYAAIFAPLRRLFSPEIFAVHAYRTGVIATISIVLIGVFGLMVGDFNGGKAALYGPHEIVTTFGETKKITLPDGSLLAVGPNTRMSIEYDKARRAVDLASGEVFFNVAGSVERPFFIDMGDKTVRVVGTEFNVNRGSQHVRVAVLEGEVEVQRNTDSQKVTLHQGEQVVSSLTGSLGSVQTIKKSTPGEWRNGRRHYESVPLSEIIDDVNRYYQPGVSLADNSLSDLTVSTSFKTDQVEAMVESLALFLPVAIEKHGDGKITISAR